MLYRKWLLRGRKAVELFELAQGLVGGINEERDVAFVHRRRQRPQPDRREQDALVAKAADEPGEPRALGPVAIGRAVVLERARLEVQQEERSAAGDLAGQARCGESPPEPPPGQIAPRCPPVERSEERRVGNEGASKCRIWRETEI